MYTQALQPVEAGAEPADAVARFQARVDAEAKIEPNDWMPEAYRRTLIRQISQHAHSEIVGSCRRGTGSRGRLRCGARRRCWPRCRTRAGTALYLYARRRHSGCRARRWWRSCMRRPARSTVRIFNYPTLSWADIGAIGWLVDGAAIMNQIPLCRCSYGPYARAMIRVCREESFHQRQGYEIMLALVRGIGGAEGDGAGCAEPVVVAVC